MGRLSADAADKVDQVVRKVLAEGPYRRRDIVRRAGFSSTVVSRALRRLKRRNLIVMTVDREGKRWALTEGGRDG